MALSQTRTEEIPIRRLIESWASAVRRRDIDGILAHHARDIVIFDVPPPLQANGIEAYGETWVPLFDWLGDEGVFDVHDLHIVAGSDVAYAHAIIYCNRARPGPADTGLEIRLTIGLRKSRTGWVVTHEHHSLPRPHED
jgi:ketosteroid isomerase-like protein